MKKIKHSELMRFVKEIFLKAGLGKEDASLIAEVLVESDVCGIDSHGINRIGRYLKAIEKGDIKIDSEPEILSEFGATVLIDANHCIGQKAGCIGMSKAIETASKYGIGMVSVRNSNHFGIAGYYSRMATEKGMIGITMTNTAPLVVPTNGREAILGTNPIAIGAPSGLEFPWLMDFATSIVPRGKLEVASKLGKMIPEGLAVDRCGDPCCNPGEILKSLESDRLGGLLNIGSHKGYGLSAAVDILCGVLSGSSFGKDVYSKGEPQVGHMFMAIDISRFMEIGEFKEKIGKLIVMLKDSHKENSEVFIHGEKEYITKKRNLEEGISFENEYISMLEKLGAEHGIVLSI